MMNKNKLCLIATFLLAGCGSRDIEVRSALVNRFGIEIVPLPADSDYLARDTNGTIWIISARSDWGLTTNFTAVKAFEAK